MQGEAEDFGRSGGGGGGEISGTSSEEISREVRSLAGVLADEMMLGG